MVEGKACLVRETQLSGAGAALWSNAQRGGGRRRRRSVLHAFLTQGNGRWGFWLGRMQRGQWSEEQAAGDEYPVE